MAMVIGQSGLQVLKDAAQYVPAPGIGVAAATALAILNLVVTADANKETFVAIGKDACTIMITIIQRVNLSASGKGVPIRLEQLNQDATLLKDEMDEIYRIVKKYAKKGILRRIVLANMDAGAVKDCQRRLDSALKLFGLQTDIEVRQQLAFLSNQVNQVLEHMRPGPQMPIPTPGSPSLPQPSLSSHPSSQAPQRTPLQTPLQTPPQTPPPQSPQPVSPQPEPQTRQERKAARHARRDARHAQAHQSVDVSGFLGVPPGSTFSNVQNHISPEGSISYSVVHGNVVNQNRDDSFNVGGSGNSINISFTR